MTQQLDEATVLESLEFIDPIIQRMNLPPAVDTDALRGAAMEAIVRALDTYDVSKGPWTAYIRFRMRCAMMDELRKLDWVPRRTRMAGVDTLQLVSFDAQVIDMPDDNIVLPLDKLISLEIEHEVLGRMQCLTGRERFVITNYYYDNMSVKQLAVLIDRTPARVGQIRTEALKKMSGYENQEK